MARELRLREIREARQLTQQKLAAELGVAQSEISKIEQRTDLYVSTLAGYLKGLGAESRIEAVFPEGQVVRISQFEEDEAA